MPVSLYAENSSRLLVSLGEFHGSSGTLRWALQSGLIFYAYYYLLKKIRTALAEKEAPHIIWLEDTPTDEPEDMIHIRFRSANLTLPADTNTGH